MVSVARETGRYLGQLHELDTPNLHRFGKGIAFDADHALQGEQPSGDPTELTFPDGYSSWRERMRDWIEDDLDALAESGRFEDLVVPIERCLTELVERIPTPVTPVVGRVDQGLWNILTDEARGRSTAWLDWGSLFAVPPAFDLAVVEYYLGGGPWMVLDEVPAHRARLRSALLEGYRTERSRPTAYELQRRCYLLDTITVTLASLDKADRKPRHLPEDRVDEAADGLRELVQELLQE
jgi:aminoglycoside phosphotransferase (APT) family kinase protein